MRLWLAIGCACFAIMACGGPADSPGKPDGKGAALLRPSASGLSAPAYHAPAGRWRAGHRALVSLHGPSRGGGFELGECFLCHQAKGCNACHAYSGAMALPKEAWQ
jgi:hypothetical protein